MRGSREAGLEVALVLGVVERGLPRDATVAHQVEDLAGATGEALAADDAERMSSNALESRAAYSSTSAATCRPPAFLA